MEYEEEVDVPSDAAFFYEASSTGETKSRLAMFKAAVVTFGAFLAWAQGKGGPFVSLPLSIKDVTEKQWVTEGTYLQYLKWLETVATWGSQKKPYAMSTVAEYFRAMLNLALNNLVSSYKAADRALPQKVETFFSCLDSNNRNDWLSIAEFNLERRVTQGALDRGEDPTGGGGGDAPLLEFEDLGKVVMSYQKEGTAESLMRAAALLDEYQTVSRSGEPLLQPWFLVTYSRTLKAVVLKRYQPKVSETKIAVWLPAAPTPEAGAKVDIFLAQAMYAATGALHGACPSSKRPVVYPSRFSLSDSANNNWMTNIL
jgi:hypothetical protein